VHVSQLSDRFVKDPAEVVRAGDRIKVRVVEVDLVRKRIALTAKSGPLPQERGNAPRERNERTPGRGAPPPPKAPGPPAPQFQNNAFARLLKK
jgi:uncharacterized protein